MQLNPFPFQKEILKQIIVEVGIIDENRQKLLKQQFDKKYRKHVNLIQYHQLREDRFSRAQQKVLQKQNLSIEKTKQIIQYRQDKAYSLKNHQNQSKSKKIQNYLSRWERIVEKSKSQHQKKLKQSARLIEHWNEKLSESTSRKSLRLYNISKTLQEKSGEKTSKILYHKDSQQEQQELKIKKSQAQQVKKLSDSRFIKIAQSRRNSRISTQSAYDRLKKSHQQLLQKSLLKIGQKIEKINSARNLKVYLQEKKNKIRYQKQENLRRLRLNHLRQIKHSVDERNEKLDNKFKTKDRNKKSLPQVLLKKSVNIIFSRSKQDRNHIHSKAQQNSPSQKLLSSHQVSSQRQTNWSPSYDKFIIQKLRNVAVLARKGKKI